MLSWCVLLAVACSANAAQKDERISSVRLRRPNIVIRGANLNRVEVWALPTGTGFEHDEHSVLGGAVRKGGAGATETWIFRLPPCDKSQLMLASEIVAVGFNASGAEIARKPLPDMGAIAVYETLCVKEGSAAGVAARERVTP
jgi:hypothetical protein